MIRALLSVVFLVALGAAIWFGVRWFQARQDLEATIIFENAEALEAGDPVVAGSLVIGEVTKVTPLQGRDAVSVRIYDSHRDRMLIDSRYRIEGERPDAILEVGSTFAFGRPVEEGDVLYARSSKIGRWLDQKGAPLVARVREEVGRWTTSDDVRTRLDEWTRDLPEWKRAGGETVQENLDAIADRVNELERDLRARGREVDAQRLRKDFSEWLAGVRRKLADEEPATATAAPASP